MKCLTEMLYPIQYIGYKTIKDMLTNMFNKNDENKDVS